MASIQTRKGKRGIKHRVMWRLEDGAQRSKTFADREEAKRFRNDVEALEQRGRAPDLRRGAVTLDEWSDAYLGTLPVKPKSIEAYRSLLRSRIGSTREVASRGWCNNDIVRGSCWGR